MAAPYTVPRSVAHPMACPEVEFLVADEAPAHGRAIIVDDLRSVELGPSQPVIYDRQIGLRLLYQDPDSGEEHYLVRYPAGLKARRHRHSTAHTIVLLEGRLHVNDQMIGPGAYCHFPPGEAMHHAPADDDSCLFMLLFHGPFDVQPLDP